MRTLIWLLSVLLISTSINAQAPTFVRGEQVRVRSVDPNRPPATTMALKVVGVPGDKLAIVGGQLLLSTECPSVAFLRSSPSGWPPPQTESLHRCRRDTTS